MRMERLTRKGQDAVRDAMNGRLGAVTPEVAPEHLFTAILEQDGGLGAPRVAKAGADPRKRVASAGPGLHITARQGAT